MRWRMRELVREILLNLRPAHLLVALLAGAVASVGAAPDVASIDRIVNEFHMRVAAGGAVWVIESEAGLVSRRCERLSADLASIRASGSILRSSSQAERTMRFLQSPGVAYPILEVTPGLVTVAGGSAVHATRGAIIGGGIAGELGVTAGTVLRTRGGEAMPIGQVLDTVSRDLGFGRDVLATAPPVAAASACWFETQPWASDSTPEVAQGLIAMSDDQTTLSPYFRNPVSVLRTAADVDERETRNSVAGTSALMVVIVSGWALLRRGADTTYRIANTTKSERVVIFGGEIVTVTVAGGCVALAVLAVQAETVEGYAVGAWAVVVAMHFAVLAGVAVMSALGLIRIDRALKE